MIKNFSKIKKWNWGAFPVIIAISLLGTLSNKSIPDVTSCLVAGLMYGIPLGLLFAYISRDEN